MRPTERHRRDRSADAVVVDLEATVNALITEAAGGGDLIRYRLRRIRSSLRRIRCGLRRIRGTGDRIPALLVSGNPEFAPDADGDGIPCETVFDQFEIDDWIEFDRIWRVG